ncbi:MAG: hypothetical protein MI974_19555 [Chitinophagales bacterium]|nr:hypothetical protein [Chitinophagales bacterium]
MVSVFEQLPQILYIGIENSLPKRKLTKMSQLKPQAPKTTTVIASVVFVLLGLFGAMIIPAIADNGDWFLLGGFVLLLIGVYVKGM